MTPDDVLTIRRTWDALDGRYSSLIPKATILATTDWMAYVTAMAASLPLDEDQIVTPTEAECRWDWNEGVAIVFEQPLMVTHTIVSEDAVKPNGEIGRIQVEPHYEKQWVRGLCLCPPYRFNTVDRNTGEMLPDKFMAHPTLWLADDLADVITGTYSFGQTLVASTSQTPMQPDGNVPILVAITSALGHRLTTVRTPSLHRAVARRVARETSKFRIIELTHNSSKAESKGSHVEWSKRWMVRGHWRLQACGFGRKDRRLIWVDPYVKGPDDKPLDVRPTIWKTS